MERSIIVHIAASADGYIARLDGSLDWLTDRPAPKGWLCRTLSCENLTESQLFLKVFLQPPGLPIECAHSVLLDAHATACLAPSRLEQTRSIDR